ncbi:MAG: diacylglycerol/lipid kinase family protein [Planctomycetota bacterium]|jgi:YegS/Rv2252/BmrU family lipid kinase
MKPEDGYITYIINPKSGSASGGLIAQKFQEYLCEKGFEVRVHLTTCLEDACEFSTDAAVDFDCGMVVVAGGDGTVREAAHGLEGSDKTLLIIPKGTENLLANELGMDRKLESLVKMFERGCIRSLDLGMINDKCFTSIAGFGFDGEVVKLVSKHRGGHIDHLAYFRPIWRTFWGHKFENFKVEVDGEEVFNGQGLVFIGNISTYAVGLKILKDAGYDDGLLDVCIYKCASRLCLLKHAFMTLLKRHKNGSDVVYAKGTNIRVSSDSNDVATEIDGDPGPKLPAEVKVLPQAVKVLVPENAKPLGMWERIVRAIG